MHDARRDRHAATTWIAALVLVVATLAVVALTPDYDDLSAPVPIDGEVGSTATGNLWSIEVERVRATRRIETDTDARETDGLFLVVDATLQATNETTYGPSIAARGDDGTTWWMSERVSSSSTLHATELSPGIGASGSFVIEVPADADVEQLRVSQGRFPVLDEQFVLDVQVPDPVDVIELEPPRRLT